MYKYSVPNILCTYLNKFNIIYSYPDIILEDIQQYINSDIRNKYPHIHSMKMNSHTVDTSHHTRDTFFVKYPHKNRLMDTSLHIHFKIQTVPNMCTQTKHLRPFHWHKSSIPN